VRGLVSPAQWLPGADDHDTFTGTHLRARPMTRVDVAVVLAWVGLIGLVMTGVSQGWNVGQICAAAIALAVVVVALHRWSHR
jgi:hypothetical protein